MKAELAKIATARKATTEVRATIEASVEVTVPVSLEYRVVDAGWDWLYEARLDTQSQADVAVPSASIRQGSGEDWVNAEVSVTTAKPRQNAGTPPVKSVFLRLQDYAPSLGSSELQEVVVTGSRIRGGRRSRDSSADGRRRSPADHHRRVRHRVRAGLSYPRAREHQCGPAGARVSGLEEAFDTELVARAADGRGPGGATRSPPSVTHGRHRSKRVACSSIAMAHMSVRRTCRC